MKPGPRGERPYCMHLLGTVLMALYSCSSEPQIDTSVRVNTRPGLAAPAPATASNDVPAAVNFYSDLLPVLNSQTPGAVYKCTTCHQNYATPAGMNSVSEVERVIAAIGVDGDMPRSGDRVAPAAVQLFRIWELQGFAPGSASLF